MMELVEDRVRIGVPYRTLGEEISGQNGKHEYYCEAVRESGGNAVPISLQLSDSQLAETLDSLDAFVTTGSPADVDPARYGSTRHAKCGTADPARERTDWAIYEHALANGKPVLAICYGVQSLNVFCGGSLIQDLPSESPAALRHSVKPIGEVAASPSADPLHDIYIEPGTQLADLAAVAGLRSTSGDLTAQVNTSHHQSILAPGHGLRVAAKAPDGVIEAVEWTSIGPSSKSADAQPADAWIVGVQWHPERMNSDALSGTLFRALVRAAAGVVPQAT